MEKEFLGIIVSSIEHKDKNLIVSVYTTEGYISVYVYNAKDYKKGNIHFTLPYTLVKFKAKGKDMVTLIDYEVVENYRYLKEDYVKGLYAYAMLYILKSPHESKYDVKIFDFIVRLFHKMKELDAARVYAIFLSKMTVIFGGKPNFLGCIICGDAEVVNFEIESGGFVCKNHTRNTLHYENGLILKKLYELDLDNEFPLWDNEKYIQFITLYYHKLSLAKVLDIKKQLPQKSI